MDEFCAPTRRAEHAHANLPWSRHALALAPCCTSRPLRWTARQGWRKLGMRIAGKRLAAAKKAIMHTLTHKTRLACKHQSVLQGHTAEARAHTCGSRLPVCKAACMSPTSPMKHRIFAPSVNIRTVCPVRIQAQLTRSTSRQWTHPLPVPAFSAPTPAEPSHPPCRWHCHFHRRGDPMSFPLESCHYVPHPTPRGTHRPRFLHQCA